MGCTKLAIYRVALQRLDALRACFMAEILVYDPHAFVWIDETGCDHRHSTRKYAYSVRGLPLCDQRILKIYSHTSDIYQWYPCVYC